ncbi:MAG TPA: hypothetical protein VKQ27_16550 [Acetobacteraceae bacterium]|nr:hypothetical protein [Acetobacteraceae bacterium]
MPLTVTIAALAWNCIPFRLNPALLKLLIVPTLTLALAAGIGFGDMPP